jgi:imidazolonepropionase-like amidohydrolase
VENMKKRILLKNINLFDVKDDILRKNVDILIENDSIKEVGKVNYVGEERMEQIDCSGKFALPGLFECHAHLTVLTNQDDATKKEILKEVGIEKTSSKEKLEKQVLKAFVVKGITQVRDVGGPVKTLQDLKDKISKGEYVGPHIFYAGPMLEKSPLTGQENNKRWPGFTVPIDSVQDAESIIEQISSEGASLVKTFGKFDEDVLKCLLDQAKEHNLPVTHDSGPTFFHPVPVDRGIDLGIRCFEHGKSPWYALLKDDLKKEHDGLIDADIEAKELFRNKVFSLGTQSISLTKLRRLIDKMLSYDVYFCPTLHIFKHYAENPEVYREDQPDKFRRIFGILYEISRFITREMIKRGVKILVGQDGWNPRFTFNEMQLLKEVGLSESEIIKSATIYPAGWLGISEQIGSISPNKQANILILNRNPLEDIQNIKITCAVLLNGKFVFRE